MIALKADVGIVYWKLNADYFYNITTEKNNVNDAKNKKTHKVTHKKKNSGISNKK